MHSPTAGRLKMFFLISCFCPLVFSQSATDAVQAKLNGITSMTAHFNQVITAGKREVAHSSGNMAILRPGCFRWQTLKPMEQLIIADGKRLWVYDTDLEQVTVKKQEDTLGGTPALFLSTYKNTVTRDFTVQVLKDGPVKAYALLAKSPKENYQKLILTFKDNSLAVIEFFDQLGQHTTIQLSQVSRNPVLQPSLFRFHPPKGTDVVEQ